MFIESLIGKWVKGQATNSTASSFSVNDTKDTFTVPAASATRSVFGLKSHIGSRQGNTLRVKPYGGGDNNDVINVKVIVWERIESTAQNQAIQYTSRTVCEVQATLSSALPGLVGGPVLSTELYADTLTLTSGIAVLHQGTADIDAAWFECDISGVEFYEILGDLGAGGDTMNWLCKVS